MFIKNMELFGLEQIEVGSEVEVSRFLSLAL